MTIALHDLLVVAAIFVLLPLCGYPVTARLRESGPAERLAIATLVGLGGLLWSLSVINLCLPLSPRWAWLCLWPIGWLAFEPMARRQLRSDLESLARSRPAAVTLIAGLLLIGLILWPELTGPHLLFHDGTSNHDAFFWISGAKYLQGHTYLDAPLVDLAHPWTNVVGAICGWHPDWGRAGAESYLAAIASLAHCDPVQIYAAASAALLIAWAAAVFMVCRTFYSPTFTLAAALALGALQPLFAFFVMNGNLPNLLGCILGGATVVATERALRRPNHRALWLGFGALMAHGTFFTYPEIAPFCALPAAVLIARAIFTHRFPTGAAVPLIAAILGSALLNPATAFRAWHGFAHSLYATQQTAQWADIFAKFSPTQYVPAVATLSLEGVSYFGSVAGGLVTLLLLGITVRTFLRADDKVGAAATFAGGAALALYTALTGFTYGWQKTAQFTAIFVAALLPIAALAPSKLTVGKSAARTAFTVVTIGIFVAALFFQAIGNVKLSRRKSIDDQWLGLRSFDHNHLAGATVLVESGTFPFSFFHGMWAAYFLPESRLVYPGDHRQNGGYLGSAIQLDNDASRRDTAAVLVSKAWADTFDADSERLYEGAQFALVRKSNRVLRLDGLTASHDGPPDQARPTIALEIEPHSPGEFQLTLDGPDSTAKARWEISTRSGTAETFTATVEGAPPWRLVAPLSGGQINRIEIRRRDHAAEAIYPVLDLKVVSRP